MIEKIKNAITDGNLAEVENLWMEMMEDKNVRVESFLTLADELKKIKETKLAFELLDLLVDHLVSEKRFAEAIAVCKHMAYFTDDDQPVRRMLIELYKKQYQNNPRIEKFLELSGIDKQEHLFKSLERLEEFLKYDIGQIFYSERWGLGEVVSMNPERRELILDFQKQKSYFVPFEVARGLLKHVPEGSFLFKKYRNIEELKLMAQEDPIGLVLFLLQSSQEPLSSGEIKKYLLGIVAEEELDKFWEKVRKRLEKNDWVKVELKKGQKIYQFIEGMKKKELYLESFRQSNLDEKYSLLARWSREVPEVFAEGVNLIIAEANQSYPQHPARCLDILYFCAEHEKVGLNYTIDDLLKYANYENLLLNLKDSDHKRKFLQEIKKREPQNWQKIFLQILAIAEDSKLSEEIEKELNNVGYNLTEIYKTALVSPQQYPQIFLLLLKKLADGALLEFLSPKYLPRVINNLEYIRGARQLFLKGFTLERFDALIKDATPAEVSKIKEELIKSPVLKSHEKNDYLKIIDYHFPSEKSIDCIYTTPEALERKKKELEYLLTVAIPENKKEISRAREYGDLSENFEYKAAKERQDQLYQRVRMIQSELQKAKVIDFNQIDTTRVCIGTRVTLQSLEDSSLLEYTILGPWDSDLSKNIISNESPLAREVLLEKKPGEIVTIEGKNYQIIKIEIAKN
ncbi:MAG: GreA/GreB family elongation factor [candidate division WOR-3 bacterium]